MHTHTRRERETNNATVVDCDDEAVGRERDERDERTAVEVVSFFLLLLLIEQRSI